MTLEHIPEAQDFITSIRRAMGKRTDSIVFVQVPEATRIFKECAFEDIYYEHCSYFTPGSLGQLFENTGFEIVHTDIEYDGQYLTVEARYGNGTARRKTSGRDLASLKELIATFPDRVSSKIDGWRESIERHFREGHKIVLWGSGSKGVSFLTTLGLDKQICAVVDINPNRQGYYMPGTGQIIIAPEDLLKIRPDLVVVMNRVYIDEIRDQVTALGLAPELAAL